jgi:tetratricopeptide (TPR) repeat protein
MKRNSDKVFFIITPLITILFTVIVFGLTFWEWKVSPNSNIDGVIAYNRENYSEAIRKFSQSQQYCETDIMARYYLGASYQKYKWNDEALDEYNVTWNLTKEYGVKAMHNAGKIWVQKKRPLKAIQFFDRALRLDSAKPEVWYDLSMVHISMKNFRSAEYCMSEAVKYHPKNVLYQQILLKLALKRQKK